MSFVGPRPEIEDYYKKLSSEEKIIFNFKPGITGLATLYFKDEENMLKNIDNPVEYNEKILWPTKTKLNLIYFNKLSFFLDISLILKTVFRSLIP